MTIMIVDNDCDGYDCQQCNDHCNYHHHHYNYIFIIIIIIIITIIVIVFRRLLIPQTTQSDNISPQIEG